MAERREVGVGPHDLVGPPHLHLEVRRAEVVHGPQEAGGVFLAPADRARTQERQVDGNPHHPATSS